MLRMLRVSTYLSRAPVGCLMVGTQASFAPSWGQGDGRLQAVPFLRAVRAGHARRPPTPCSPPLQPNLWPLHSAMVEFVLGPEATQLQAFGLGSWTTLEATS